MKKRVPMNDPNPSHPNDPFLTDLFANIDEVQKLVPETPPHLQLFKTLVETTTIRERQRMTRDLLLFLMVATLIAVVWVCGIQFDLQVVMWFLVTISILSIIGTFIGLIWFRFIGVRSL